MPNRIPNLSATTREREIASRDAAPVIARCLHCPGWIFRGTALEARTEAQRHRLEQHPELRPRRRRSSRGLGGWTSYLHPEDEAELRAERQRRMRLLGLEVDG